MRSLLLAMCLCTPSYYLSAADIHVPADHSTIQAAVNAAVSADVVIVAAGTYFESVSISNKDITLRGAGAGFTIIDGPSFGAALNVSGTTVATIVKDLTIAGSFDGVSASSPLTLEFCEVRDNTHDGVALEDNSGGVVANCDIHSNGDDGIDIDNRVDVLIENNTIHDNGDPSDSGQDGIEIRLHNNAIASTLNIIIRNNTISKNLEDGIQIIDHSANATDRSIIIERNIICDNLRAGIGLMDGGDTEEDYRAADIAEPITTMNNTIVGNNHGISGGDNMTSGNNIIADNTVLGMKNVDGSSTSDYNLFFNNGTGQVNTNLGGNSLMGFDPLLEADKSLGAGSPAINAGDPNCVPVNGTRCDIGAVESGVSTLPVELANFTALSESGAITLAWTTHSESDNSGFEVQCSSKPDAEREIVGENTCGVVGWSTMAWEDGAGNSSSETSYQIEIEDIEPGRYFFRLKQVDFDGSSTYSSVVETVLVPEDRELDIELYPNPISINTPLNLTLVGNSKIQISIFDVMGRQVGDLASLSIEGHRQLSIDLGSWNLSPGSYWIKVQTGLRSHTSQLVVN